MVGIIRFVRERISIFTHKTGRNRAAVGHDYEFGVGGILLKKGGGVPK